MTDKIMKIKTVYHIKGKKMKTLRSKDANRAVAQCVRHMIVNHYGSHLAEVYDDGTGELHAQLKLMKDGTLVVYMKRDAKQFETRWALSYLIGA